jgi:hypothetical protein
VTPKKGKKEGGMEGRGRGSLGLSIPSSVSGKSTHFAVTLKNILFLYLWEVLWINIDI